MKSIPTRYTSHYDGVHHTKQHETQHDKNNVLIPRPANMSGCTAYCQHCRHPGLAISMICMFSRHALPFGTHYSGYVLFIGYVPPHSRRGDGTSTATSFSLSHDTSGPGKLGTARAGLLPPGAAPPDTKSASKNSKRRSKKKGLGTDAEDAAVSSTAPAVDDSPSAGQQH